MKNIVSSIDFYADNSDYENIKVITRKILGQEVFNRKITGCIPIDAVLNQKISKYLVFYSIFLEYLFDNF